MFCFSQIVPVFLPILAPLRLLVRLLVDLKQVFLLLHQFMKTFYYLLVIELVFKIKYWHID